MAYTIFNFTDGYISISKPHCNLDLTGYHQHKTWDEGHAKGRYPQLEQHTWKTGKVPGLILVEPQNIAD